MPLSGPTDSLVEGPRHLQMDERVPTPAALSAAIQETLARYLRDGEASSVLEVNNGLCEDFAGDVKDVLGADESDRFCMLGYENLVMTDPEWMTNYFPASLPPVGLTWDDIGNLGMADTHHVWLVLDGRHYDADIPEGADSAFDLPVFRRNIVCALRRGHQDLLERLASEPWWQESIRMHEEFSAWMATDGSSVRSFPEIL